ncbi:MAG: sigma-70 family RNA polymerase sigma factor [Clostridia bacterium]|nr:sigma-70 family RNA polymerase sigma factor [Clostridia bacterium]
MDLRPFTKEEQQFAEENHDLVYAFLNEKKLSEDEYYDVVVFGYLRAVQMFKNNPKFYKYKFSTLAWKQMQGELANYYKYLLSPKRCASVISLDEPIDDENGLCIADTISYDDIMSEIKEELLMHELAKKLSPREMRIVKMKVRGDKMHTIAKAERLTFQEINRLLDNIYPTVRKIFYG